MGKLIVGVAATVFVGVVACQIVKRINPRFLWKLKDEAKAIHHEYQISINRGRVVDRSLQGGLHVQQGHHLSKSGTHDGLRVTP